MSPLAVPAIAKGDLFAGANRRAWPWRRQPTLYCAQVRPALPAILDGDVAASSALVVHVEYCLACQAELARYRRLLRLLHQMRATDAVVPPGVVGDVLSSLESAAKRRAIRSLLAGRRVAYAAALVSAAGAAASLVVVAVARSRGPGAERQPDRPVERAAL